MGILKALLRIYSYLFGLLLSLFLLGISIISLRSGSPLNLEFLPWSGPALAQWLFGSGIVGLIFVLLAIGGRVRVLYFLWAVALFVILLRGFFLTPYKFLGLVSFKPAVYLTVGALIAAIGAFPWPPKPGPVRRPQFY